MPVYDAVIDPDKPSRIILGTDLGVFVTENGGTNWTEANTGMARVPVFEIRGYEWKPWEGMKLYIGTHGRGYYQSMSLTTGVKKVPSVFTGINAFPVPATDALNVTFNSVSSEKVSIEVYSLNGSKMQSLTLNATAGQNKARLNIASLSNGSYFVRITGAQGSNAVKFTVMK